MKDEKSDNFIPKGEGIRAQLQQEGSKFYSVGHTITREQLKASLNDLIEGAPVSSPQYSMVGIDFLKSWRREYGDESFYRFVTGQYLMLGREAYDYIEEFLAGYEKRKEKKKKPVTLEDRNRVKQVNKDYGNKNFYKKFR